MVVNPVKGPNAIISEIRILSSDPRQLAAVSEESREALKSVQAYVVDTQVDAEQVLPTYVPVPASVKDVYRNQLSLNGGVAVLRTGGRRRLASHYGTGRMVHAGL